MGAARQCASSFLPSSKFLYASMPDPSAFLSSSANTGSTTSSESVAAKALKAVAASEQESMFDYNRARLKFLEAVPGIDRWEYNDDKELQSCIQMGVLRQSNLTNLLGMMSTPTEACKEGTCERAGRLMEHLAKCEKQLELDQGTASANVEAEINALKMHFSS